MDININDEVTVILTEYGISVLQNYKKNLEQYTDLKFEFTLTQDINGKYTTELWNLMFIFGQHMSMSLPQVFLHNKIYTRK
jgi:hypothetical protein